jgi:hypothetical protein
MILFLSLSRRTMGGLSTVQPDTYQGQVYREGLGRDKELRGHFQYVAARRWRP